MADICIFNSAYRDSEKRWISVDDVNVVTMKMDYDNKPTSCSSTTTIHWVLSVQSSWTVTGTAILTKRESLCITSMKNHQH